ncbi:MULTISPECIES: hypothetical protein [Agrobacterium tumefaciens complex]|uniref:Uncharacterized protein n=1 Tax=Agrobacterium radiobacter TaxID=362 RepID=A0ABD5LB80_AGRRD|nr:MULTISPECIES: hypothetical protein [Agrobacterium tumefaciens complex]MCP2135489.1 hypothetical protein [Rhizobium sp. SLBN-94]TGE82147.1 hypothetical protein C9410_03580 [Rhizobium sp. SEMIA 439]EPR10073.1 hypothetical protein L902_15565 [Agrobacterium radiobacter DSM 30147]KAA1236283.1 hypothetical protein FHL81_05955 [Agrobacterium tumefaciens]KAB0458581.1 hypothetical protein F7R04_17610 [Agrobacterium tumefaciens]
MFSEIGRKLLKANRKGARSFLKRYEENFIRINQGLVKHNGVKTDLNVGYDEESLNRMRFAALMSDVVTFSLMPDKKLVMRLFSDPSKRPDVFGNDFRVTVDSSRLKYVQNSDGTSPAAPAFVHSDHAQSRQVVDTIAPLMLRGKAILRPHRTLLLPAALPKGEVKWEMIDAQQDSPFDHWSCENAEAGQPVIPVREQELSASPNEVGLFNIALPFLSGVGFHDLATVLEDEELHLAKARVALKKVVEEANAGNLSKQTVVNEILRPELDALERRFKAISRSKMLKQGSAGIGVATLSLVAFSTAGLLPAVGAALGSGGLGLFAKDWLADREKAEALADSPYYLLWRLRGLQH